MAYKASEKNEQDDSPAGFEAKEAPAVCGGVNASRSRAIRDCMMNRIMEGVRQLSAQAVERLRTAHQHLFTLTTRMVKQTERVGTLLIAQGTLLGRQLATMLHRGIPLVRQVMAQTTQRIFQMVWCCWTLVVWGWKALTAIGVIGGLLSLISLYADVSSRLSVTPHSPLNPADILSTPFIVENSGHFPVKMMQFTCWFSSVSLEDEASGKGGWGQNIISFDTEQFNIPTLNPTQQTTIYCPAPIQSSQPLGFVKSADLIIMISYKVVLLPLSFRQSFRFTTTADHQSNLRWLPQPY
jgi:hypothetical protein